MGLVTHSLGGVRIESAPGEALRTVYLWLTESEAAELRDALNDLLQPDEPWHAHVPSADFRVKSASRATTPDAPLPVDRSVRGKSVRLRRTLRGKSVRLLPLRSQPGTRRRDADAPGPPGANVPGGQEWSRCRPPRSSFRVWLAHGLGEDVEFAELVRVPEGPSRPRSRTAYPSEERALHAAPRPLRTSRAAWTHARAQRRSGVRTQRQERASSSARYAARACVTPPSSSAAGAGIPRRRLSLPISAWRKEPDPDRAAQAGTPTDTRRMQLAVRQPVNPCTSPAAKKFTPVPSSHMSTSTPRCRPPVPLTHTTTAPGPSGVNSPHQGSKKYEVALTEIQSVSAASKGARPAAESDAFARFDLRTIPSFHSPTRGRRTSTCPLRGKGVPSASARYAAMACVRSAH